MHWKVCECTQVHTAVHMQIFKVNEKCKKYAYTNEKWNKLSLWYSLFPYKEVYILKLILKYLRHKLQITRNRQWLTNVLITFRLIYNSFFLLFLTIKLLTQRTNTPFYYNKHMYICMYESALHATLSPFSQLKQTNLLRSMAQIEFKST